MADDYYLPDRMDLVPAGGSIGVPSRDGTGWRRVSVSQPTVVFSSKATGTVYLTEGIVRELRKLFARNQRGE